MRWSWRRPRTAPAPGGRHLRRVPDVATLEQLLARSEDVPVILFNHDRACPMSTLAYRELIQLPGEIALIDVQRAPVVTRALATRTGVRHESPQVIVVRHGDAVWSASHLAITADAVARAIDEQAALCGDAIRR